MKVNQYICLIATVAIAMLTSISSAQTIVPSTIEGIEVGTSVRQSVVQNAADYIVGDAIVPAQPAFESGPEVMVGDAYMPAPVIQACDCCQESCGKCRRVRQRPACGCKRSGCQGDCEVAATPMFQSCEGDFCKLSTKQELVDKICFKTEQVPVCIPAVRLPWQKCCPPSKSRTRLVNKLSLEKSEVEACVYKWTVEETNDCGCGSPGEAPAAAIQGSLEPAKADMSPEETEAETLKAVIEEDVVPPAPAVKGAFLRGFRKR